MNLKGFKDLHFRCFASFEKSVVSVERIKEYQESETEADFEKPEIELPPEWPKNGKIEFDNYKTRYRKGLDYVLKGEVMDKMPNIFDESLMKLFLIQV